MLFKIKGRVTEWIWYRSSFFFFFLKDAVELGAVFIGTENHQYSVSEGSSKCARGGRWHGDIRLQTPGRQFVFKCEQEQEQREWLEALRRVIGQPMTSEDYASMASLPPPPVCSQTGANYRLCLLALL